LLVAFLGLIPCLAASCGTRGPTEAAALSEEELEERISELALALVEPGAMATNTDFMEWKNRRRSLIDELGGGSPQIGRALLERLEDEQLAGIAISVQKGFLEVAARSSPEAATPRLLELFETYGHPLDLRQAAAQQLAVTAPALAIETFEPLLEVSRMSSTMPGHEFLLEAYLVACASESHDPLHLLVAITTGILYESDVRHAAIKALGERPSEMGFHALEQALIESTGNVYLRRLAAQALIASAPESCCEVLRRVAENEADVNFLNMLGNMLDLHCP